MRKMKKERFRKLAAGLSAVCLAAALGVSASVPVLAAEGSSVADSSDTIVTFVLEDADGSTTKSVDYDVTEKGEPRSTYYDQETGKDYDLVSGSGSSYTYRVHQDSSYDVSVTCVTDDGTILKTETGSVSSGSPTVSFSVDKEISVGGRTYTTSSGSVTFDYNDIDLDNLDREVVYTLKDDTSTDYYVTVNYETEAGELIEARQFHVNGRDHTFIAPKYYSRDVNGKTTYYKAVSSTTFNHKVGDTTRTYTVTYTAEPEESYSWYIMLYDSSTNECIDVKTVEVKPGETAEFTPEGTVTAGGQTYTVNKSFSGTLSHTFGSSNRTSYIYYDPAGYENNTDVKTRTVTVQYTDIASGSVISTETVTATSAGDTHIDFPDSFDSDGIHYLRVDGQVAGVEHSYYSPKTLYTVYYRDENNTEFEHVTITTEEIQEIEVTSGDTTYTVLPGITRYVATDTSTGVSRVISTADASGSAVNTDVSPSGTAGGTDGTGSADGTASGSTASGSTGGAVSDDGDVEVTIDGIQADDIRTPQSNIHLNERTAGTPVAAIVIGCILAAAAVALIWLLIVRSRRNRADGQ